MATPTMAARIDNLEKELRCALARNEQLAGVVYALTGRVCKLEEFETNATYDLNEIERELGMVFPPKKQPSEASDVLPTPGEDDDDDDDDDGDDEECLVKEAQLIYDDGDTEMRVSPRGDHYAVGGDVGLAGSLACDENPKCCSPKRSAAASNESPDAVVAEKPTGAVLGVSQDQNKGDEFTIGGKDAFCHYLFGEGESDSSDSESKYTRKKKKPTRKKKKKSRESDQDALGQKPDNPHKKESVANVKVVGNTVSKARKIVKARRIAAASTAAPAEPTNTELDDANAAEWEPIHDTVNRLKKLARLKPILAQGLKLFKDNAKELSQFKIQVRVFDCVWLAQVLQHCEHEGSNAHLENVLREIKYIFKKYGSHLGSFYTNDDDSKELKKVLQSSLVEVKDQAIYGEMESLSKHLNIGDSCCKLIATVGEQVKKVHDQPQIAAKPAPEFTMTNLAKPIAKQQEPVSADPITQPQIAAKRQRIVSSEISSPEDDDSSTCVSEQHTERKSYNTGTGYVLLRTIQLQEKQLQVAENSEVAPPAPASPLSGLIYPEEQARMNEEWEEEKRHKKEEKRRKKEEKDQRKRLRELQADNEVEANKNVCLGADNTFAAVPDEVMDSGWSDL